jgi:DNA end-binding protein Ku
MASRNLYLRLSLVTVPVTMQPATTRAKRIQLRMLNPDTGTRLKERMIDAETEMEVAHDEAARGYEYEKGRFVTIEPDELEQLEQQRMDSKKVIELEQFVAADGVPAEYFATPYYLLPQDEMATEAYAVIRDALKRTGTIALGRVVLSTREHAVAIRPEGGGLALTTLRSAEEVRAAPALFAELARDSAPDDLIAVAEQLIAKKSGSFDPSQWRDRYQAALQALIEAKLQGLPVAAAAAAAPAGPNVVNLFEALRRSVEAADTGSKPPAARQGKRAIAAKAKPETKRPATPGKRRRA